MVVEQVDSLCSLLYASLSSIIIAKRHSLFIFAAYGERDRS
jgi:hypothetical protein